MAVHRSPGEPRRSLPFHPGLDGLRGLSVAVVLLFHADFAWMGGGFLGVSTFFTLSGFLITGLLLADHGRTGRIDFARFYARRVRRILPAALVTLLGIALFGALLATPTQLERLRGDGLSALFQVANWWLVASGADYAGQLGSPSPVQHFWSLAIEEQFYALYPGLLALLLWLGGGRRRVAGAVVAAAILGCWALGFGLEAGDASNARLYYGSDVRAGEILAGALLAIAWHPAAGLPVRHGVRHGVVRQGLLSGLGVAGLAIALLFWCSVPLNDPFLYRGGLAIYTLASVALLAAAILPGGPIRRLLSLTPLRWLGRISYGAYLFHWPLYLWLDAARTGLDPLPLAALRVGVTLVLADLSHRGFEQPIRQGRWIHGWRRVAVPGVAIVAVLASFAGVTPAQEPRTALASSAAAPAAEPRAEIPRIFVVGDSVSLEVGQGLRAWAGERAIVEVNGTRACGLARGGYLGASAASRERECDRWETRWRAGGRPDLVVIVASNWDVFPRMPSGWDAPRLPGDPRHDDWLRSELRAAHGMLAREGAEIVWLTAACRRKDLRLADGSLVPMGPLTRHLNEQIVRPVALEMGGPDALIDFGGRVCPGGVFRDELDGVRVRHADGVHFSGHGRRWLAEWLGPELLRRLEGVGAETLPARSDAPGIGGAPSHTIANEG
ncbi:MAG: acyltransferase family protein [Chromatiales bacterium]|jgi:peptidoglycan/LPS O-acetylase OafA/YrhL